MNMNRMQKLPWSRRAVLIGTGILFAAWLSLHVPRLFSSQNGSIRFALTAIFSLMILLRPKPDRDSALLDRTHATALISTAAFGMLLMLAGLIFNVGQFEWVGLLCLLWSCLRWSLPEHFGRDILMSMTLLYWAHPLPGQLFAPMQMAMQRMSVSGSEWLLHIFNVRVWGDDLVLRTSQNAYEVPEWCSGMRTATTVFLLALGLGILKRMRALATVGLVVAALAQALALNVIRISLMVALSYNSNDGTSINFLHHTAGIVVMGGMILVYLETELLHALKRRRRESALDTHAQPITSTNDLPPFWIDVGRRRLVPITGAVVLVLTLVGMLAYRSRPYHRTEMIRDVALGLEQRRDLEHAERAARQVQSATAFDEEWELLIVRIMLLRQKYDEVLDVLERLPDFDGIHQVERSILKAYALMARNRMPEAAATVRTLPASRVRSDARVAMILAEMGLYSGNPDDVAAHVTRAAQWPPNRTRIRSLYPYLRRFRKWHAIVDSDTDAPYTNATEAMSAAEAYMNLNIAPVAARMALRAVESWPTDPRVLELLFFMTITRTDGIWEDHFADHLRRCVDAVNNVNVLYGMLGKSFQIFRPDLAWLTITRLQDIAPSHPCIPMSLALHGADWFRFRRRFLGLPAANPFDTIDIKALFLTGTLLPEWRYLCHEIPFGNELARPDTVETRKAFLAEATTLFRERLRAGNLELAMRYEYVSALEMAGDMDALQTELASIVAEHPEESHKARIAFSGVYERRGDWQQVYETLRGQRDSEALTLTPLVRLGEAQMHLRLGSGALHTAWRAWRRYPTAPQAVGLLARALSRYGDAEDAHHILSRPRVRTDRELDLLEARLRHETERFSEVDQLSRSSLLPRLPVIPGTEQKLFLPPAELTALWHRVSVPGESEFKEVATRLRHNLTTTTSPFLRDLLSLWLECYDAHCGGRAADTDRWLAIGRDDVEKTTALSQLALLQCREENYAAARNLLGKAVKLLPDHAPFWHMLISLSGVDRDVIAAARRACPEDGQIWLAELVCRTQQETAALEETLWVSNTVQQAMQSGTFSAGTLTRAAEYLFRGPHKDTAVRAARHAAEHARGLLPAYVVAAKCALYTHNRSWAIAMTDAAVKASLTPPLRLYEKMVELKASGNTPETDMAMVEALTTLRRDQPEDMRWAEMLGHVRFHRGGWELVDSLYQMTAVLAAGATNRTPVVIGAEASRLLGNYERASEILRKGLDLHPGDVTMLNNLAYTLAQSPGKHLDALKLVPQLEAIARSDPGVLDTIAFIQYRNQDLIGARATAQRIVELSRPCSRARFRAQRLLAQITLSEGNPEEAEGILSQLLRSIPESVPDEDVVEASIASRQIAEALDQKRRLREDIERGRVVP